MLLARARARARAGHLCAERHMKVSERNSPHHCVAAELENSVEEMSRERPTQKGEKDCIEAEKALEEVHEELRETRIDRTVLITMPMPFCRRDGGRED